MCLWVPEPGHSLESAEVELIGVVPEEHLAAVVFVSTAGHEVQCGSGRPDDPTLLQPRIPGVQDGLNHELKLRGRKRHMGDTVTEASVRTDLPAAFRQSGIFTRLTLQSATSQHVSEDFLDPHINGHLLLQLGLKSHHFELEFRTGRGRRSLSCYHYMLAPSQLDLKFRHCHM